MTLMADWNASAPWISAWPWGTDPAAPADRTLVVGTESRTFVILAETRTLEVPS